MKAQLYVPRPPSPRLLRAAAAHAFAQRNRGLLDGVRAPQPGEVPLSDAEVRLLRGFMRTGELLS